MKPAIATLLLAICLLSQSFLGFSHRAVIYPIYDPTEFKLPRNLRTSHSVTKKSSLNLEGLQCLRASGSGQFSEKTYAAMLQHLPVNPQQLIVLDLRQESHGFINGSPVCWTDGKYNYGNIHRTRVEIESDEFQRLRLAAQARRIIVNPAEDPSKLTVYTVKTERDFIESHGSTYIRLPVTDHNRPANEVIDQFVELVKNLPEDQWLHFHCRAGKGRTTTFLILFDIIRNADHVSFNDIIARQQFIGGSDLSDVKKNDLEKNRAANERLEFVKRFYFYCRQVPDFKIKWSEWVEKNHSLYTSR